ncbi:MAG: amino acid ABC transporter permease [Chloroflexi bacterium]|nr:amino acid ABC transporter permease [Chloroflexota bacterium]MCI0772874.1 amino acid ABC transporter permease [Chloroflexota bacterium]MCI0827160.1 amino acid ABC transporter permease [Chloroflexota bacterium]MDK1044505.1 amino acid ABC transporter permease [Anaerolineales bacterium]TDI87154.1 MAG: amino acid ABC transporter permease [Chloroflexota bacterium]
MAEAADPGLLTLRPPEPPGPLAWIRKNLLNTWYNALLTILSFVVLYIVLSAILRWAFFQADWRPVTRNPLLYLVGSYPRAQLWRVGLSLQLVSLLLGISTGLQRGSIRYLAVAVGLILGASSLLPLTGELDSLTARGFLLVNPLLIALGYVLASRLAISGRLLSIGWLASLVLIPILLRGFSQSESVPTVETTAWGGLLVTLFLAVGGILLSFPIGVLLALGRRSTLPVVKLFSTAFIEIVRGVPLVTILFMSSIILALFLPQGFRIDRLIRALLGMTLFSAAYMAENVRGGLQTIPKGQIDAAKAVGLSNFQTTLLIVLPQALRAVIPTIVGQLISLFKDTTLAIIVAINELLSIGKAVLQSDIEFLQLQLEVFVFIAAVFWIFSSVMSYSSRRLEERLGVGER